MNKKRDTFTSTGSKLLLHPYAILDLTAGFAKPISLQIAPTSKCNLNCVFCSNASRTKHEELTVGQVKKVIDTFHTLGIKTVEWTGGGDPTCWEGLVEAAMFADSLGLEQGMITNGIQLKDADTFLLKNLKWIRISMNCLDYVKTIEIPEIKGTLGMSYVINEKTDDEIINRIGFYVTKHKPAYVRVVPDCRTTKADLDVTNSYWSKIVESWEEPFFYQEKIFDKPERCWWGNLKPFVLHDGYVYPCSSVVLNSDSENKFNEKYRWYPIEEIEAHYDGDIKSFRHDNCDHCVFTEQNEDVDSIINPVGMENFI